MSECECANAGWCQKHQMNKPESWFRLCQRSEEYRWAWDQGFGPGQLKRPEGKERKVSRKLGGVGTELRKMLGNHCNSWQHANQMDRWGIDGCLDRTKEIVALIMRDGQRDASPLDEKTAIRLFMMAIDRAVMKERG